MSDGGSTSRQVKAGAGAAGAGSGMLLVLVANNLPENSVLKPWLLLAAPSVSVFFSALWLWFNVKIANYLRDREVKLLLKEAKQTLEEALKNNQTTQAHRNQLRKELEKLEFIAVGRHMKRIQAIKVITEEDVKSQQRT